MVFIIAGFMAATTLMLPESKLFWVKFRSEELIEPNDKGPLSAEAWLHYRLKMGTL